MDLDLRGEVTESPPGEARSGFAETDSMGCRQRRLCRLRLRLSPQDRRGKQCDGEANREGLDEGHRCVEERIVFHLLVFSHLLKLRLNGGRTRARGLELL